MDDYEGLSHSKWECKYRGSFIPKCRRKTLYGELRQHLGEVFGRIGNAEGVQGRRGAFDARSCPHDDFDPAQICGVAGDRVHQGEERNPLGPRLWRAKAQPMRRRMVDRMLTRCETTLDRRAAVDSAAALRDRISTRESPDALRRGDGGRRDSSDPARSDRCVTCLPSSAKVVTLSGNYSDDFAIFWMTHCPPALFKLPQNWAASSVDPNGPTMVR
jgi:hypothetical protein